MARKRSWSDDDLVNAVKDSESIAGVLSNLSITPSGGNYKNIQIHIERLDLNIDHFTGRGWRKGKSHGGFQGQPLEEILVENSTYTNTGSLKKRLLRDGLVDEECFECGQEPYWNGKPLVLQLDHKNGNNRDHTLDNLRLLCPNCHTQTKTFCRSKGE